MLALGIQYLTGYVVATDVSNRERAEWPPHPGRIFMALAAAHFETGEDAQERDSLTWIEELGPPAIHASGAEPRDVVTCYVPVNDSGDPMKKDKALTPLQSAAIGRDRQPRTFPCVRPWHDTVFLVWPDALSDSDRAAALDRLCEKVTRIGHSSSLVQMWVEPNPPDINLVPSPLGEHLMRTPGPGTLGELAAAYNGKAIEDFAALNMRIANSKGKAKSQFRQELADRFGDNVPTSLRPVIGQWHAYCNPSLVAVPTGAVSGAFDPHLTVLSIQEGPFVGLESTWRILTAMRDTILSTCDPTPEWVNGHEPDGSPSQQSHLALLPLAFVGHEHADGHIMGIALAFPNRVDPRERGRALRRLLYDDNGLPKTIELKLGSMGILTLARETRSSPPNTLQPTTWTAPSDTWATVTPIVVDRHPKVDRATDRGQWSQEVVEIIAESCQRQGLPRPVAVDVDKTSWFRGVPRAVAGNGAGYPLLPVKGGQTKRQQVHAWLQFDAQISGPLVLGAGRYRGYGLCRPWKGVRQ